MATNLNPMLLLVPLVALSACAAQPPRGAPAPPAEPKAAPAPAGFVWWEGERPEATNFPARSWFSADTIPDTRHLLSEGDWLSNSGDRTGDEAFARYLVEVPAAGRYAFWTRKFWKHGPFRWRFDQADWQACGGDVALADNTELRTHLGANWVYLGEVELTAGRHTFELRLLAGPGQALTACFDCFVLTTGPFTPRGRLKPGERSGQADPGYFAWEPPTDPFTADSAFDLRGLNEPVAGANGHLRADGRHLVLGDGTPTRFWAINLSANSVTQDRASVDYLARRLAKVGVNLVRFHTAMFATGDEFGAINQPALDGLHYLVAALKQQGIYTSISFHFPLWHDVRPAWGFEGYDQIENKKPFALLFFDPKYQLLYRAAAQRFLSATNPHTGLSLAQDPGVASLELINEDSFFFWTFTKQNVPPAQWRKLEGAFAGWLRQRYGTLEAALAAWDGFGDAGDEPAAGRIGVLEAWHMTGQGSRQGPPGKLKRVGDQVRFLTETQRRFYAETIAYLRERAQLACLVSCSNWTVSDPATLDALERYTYTAGDIIDRHGYFDAPHEGEGAGYSVRVGHTAGTRSAVANPEGVPIQVFQVADRPHTISEIGWPQPNRLRADATLFCAAYGALQGLDAIYWFALGANSLVDSGIAKFQIGEPLTVGSFPACALAYRRGDIAESDAVVHQVVRLEDLYAMRGSGAASDRALDAVRAVDVPPGGQVAGAIGDFDPLTFYVGRVEREYGEDPAASRQIDLTRYIDRTGRTVTSVTGETHLDFGAGLLRVDTARCQGVAGHLGEAGPVECGALTVDCRNAYGQIVAIALDDQPLATSRRILIQALTAAQPYGWRMDGQTIANLGAAPFGLERVEATLGLKLAGDGAPRAVVLDENGYRTARTVPIQRAGETWTLALPADGVYCLVER